MGRNMVRWLGVAVLVLGGSLAAYAHDTDEVSASAFDVTLSETVRVAVGTQPLPTPKLFTEGDLEARYFSLETFTAKVWAITNYQVSGGVGLAGTASGALLALGAAAIRVQIVGPADFAGADDGDTDNPKSDVAAGSPYTALPLTPAQALWNGGNTEGGSLTAHEATVHLWLDLDQLGDQAAGNVLTVTVNLLVTET